MQMKKMKWLPPASAAQIAATGTDAYRVASEASAWIERFGPAYRVSADPSEDLDRREVVRDLRDWIDRLADIPPVAETVPNVPLIASPASPRLFWRDLAAHAQDQAGAVELDWEGVPVSPQSQADTAFTAQELGVSYGIDFGGYSAGLFLDQRANRERLIEVLADRVAEKGADCRVLNCFAYTGAFSVVAARAGASTTTLDLSKAALARAKENFARNGIALTESPVNQGVGDAALPQKRHHFIADDCFAALRFLAKKKLRFDAIILDPPTFSRGSKRKVWRAETDYAELVALALPLCGDRASVLLSTNATSLCPDDLAEAARVAVLRHRDAGGKCVRLDFSEAPEQSDFPADSGGCSSTLWMTVRA